MITGRKLDHKKGEILVKSYKKRVGKIKNPSTVYSTERDPVYPQYRGSGFFLSFGNRIT